MDMPFANRLSEATGKFVADPFSAVTRQRQSMLVLTSALLLLVASNVVTVSGSDLGGIGVTVREERFLLLAGMVVCFYFIMMYRAAIRLDMAVFRVATSRAEAEIAALLDEGITSRVTRYKEVAEEIDLAHRALQDDPTPGAGRKREELRIRAVAAAYELPTDERKALEDELRQLKTVWTTRNRWERRSPLALGGLSLMAAGFAILRPVLSSVF